MIAQKKSRALQMERLEENRANVIFHLHHSFPHDLHYTSLWPLWLVSNGPTFITLFWDDHTHNLFTNMKIWGLHCLLVTTQFSSNKNRGVFLKTASKFWNLAKNTYQHVPLPLIYHIYGIPSIAKYLWCTDIRHTVMRQPRTHGIDKYEYIKFALYFGHHTILE